MEITRNIKQIKEFYKNPLRKYYIYKTQNRNFKLLKYKIKCKLKLNSNKTKIIKY